MVWCKGLGVLRRYRRSILGLVWIAVGLSPAHATPITQVFISGKDGQQTSFVSILKKFGTFTPEQESVLDKISVPYTSAEKAEAFIKSMHLPESPYLAAKFTDKFNAMQNNSGAGPVLISSEAPKILKIFRDSFSSEEEELPRESALPVASANIPKPGSGNVTLNEAMAHYQNLDGQQSENEKSRSPFNLEEDGDEDLEREAMTPPVLGRCDKDNTTRIKNDYRINEGPKGLRFDSLFVDANSPEATQLQSENDLALIGATTYLFPYRSEPGDLLSLQAVEYGATCLPFRIRVTDKFIYFHSGEAAFRNYDKNPDGNGVVAKSAPTQTSDSGGKP